MQLIEVFDATQLCPECQTLRTIRSRHCNVCHRCVERFDHHCPWINNCVGVQNHNWFMLYLTSQYFLLATTIANGVLTYFSEDMTLGWLAPYFIIGQEWQTEEQYYLIALGGILLISGLFFLPINLLFYVQITNYLKGMTTNERFGRGANRHDSEFSEENTELLQKLRTVSTGMGSQANEGTDPALLVRRPTGKSQKLNRTVTEQKPFDVNTMMKKLQSKEFRNMDKMRVGNCSLMCCHSGVRDQLEIYNFLMKPGTG